MKKKATPTLLKIDLGCGPNPKAGFQGADLLDFGQKWKMDLRKRWPWADGSVAEAHSSHTVEHLTAVERVHFFNELWRVLVPGGKAQVLCPNWASQRAYGDPTHQWPPVSAFMMYYLSKEWRAANAPHTDVKHWKDGYSCDFTVEGGYGLNPAMNGWHDERKAYSQQWYIEAALDIFFNLEKKA